jgi:hypothetical protein
MFASATILAHLLRGAVAAVLIVWAWLHQSSAPVFAAAAAVSAIVAMRGCPLCWVIGLCETIGERIRIR